MLRYLAGLVLVQLVTLGLFVLNADAEPRALALSVGVPALAIALLAALWFRTLSRVDAERDLARTRLEHERERERFRTAAEREREKVVREAERTVRREERRVARRASAQVGLAFAATAGMGVLFVVSELVTLGLLTLATGGGALGGYVLRWRQTRAASAVVDTPVGAAPIGALESASAAPAGGPATDGDERPVEDAPEAPLALPSPMHPLPSEPARARGGRQRKAPGRAGV